MVSVQVPTPTVGWAINIVGCIVYAMFWVFSNIVKNIARIANAVTITLYSRVTM